jgi:hypothetical protein
MNREIELKIFDMIDTLSTCLAGGVCGLGLLDRLNDVSKDLYSARVLAAKEVQEEVLNETN